MSLGETWPPSHRGLQKLHPVRPLQIYYLVPDLASRSAFESHKSPPSSFRLINRNENVLEAYCTPFTDDNLVFRCDFWKAENKLVQDR